MMKKVPKYLPHQEGFGFEIRDEGSCRDVLFFGLEVWKILDEIFNHGKYTIEILHRFGMIYCKPMTTPMEANLKKPSDYALDSYLVDPTMYS